MNFKVVLVDDEKMVLNSLALGINWEDAGFEVIETCTNSVEAFDRMCALRPDVAFLDIKMPNLNGLELMKKTKEVLPKLKFVMISGHAEFSYVQKALSYGATAYCLKPFEDDELYSILSMLKEKLEDEQDTLESKFLYLLELQDGSASERLAKILLEEGFLPNDTTMAISIGSIRELIDSDVHFIEIRHTNNEYLYFFGSSERIRNIVFQRRVAKAIADTRIKSFRFCLLSEFENDVPTAFAGLKEQVYRYFYLLATIIDFEVQNLPRMESSPYIKEIETNACKNNIVEVLNLLSEYKTSFQAQNPSMSNLLKLYNICISLIYRLDDNYFDDAIESENALVSAFESCDLMIEYIIKMLSGYSTNKINMDLIKNDTFKQILEYINGNFTDAISFQQICTAHSINPSYLSQVFKKEIGTTFTNYLTQLRVNYAKDLLLNTNLLVSEISQKVGYDQYFYFAKIFKKATSMPPKLYRETAQV